MIQTSPTVQQAYLGLKSLVQTGRVQPGEPLSERDIAQRLSISRTPVREAMKTLAREGLLEIVPTRGTFVRRLSVRDLQEIHQVRLAIERMAACLAAQMGATLRLHQSAEELSRLRSLETIDVISAQAAGWEFHDAMFEAARNSRLTDIYSTLRDQSGLAMRQMPSYDAVRSRDAICEHIAIYEAIIAGDAEQAQNLVSDHLNRALQAKISMIATGINAT